MTAGIYVIDDVEFGSNMKKDVSRELRKMGAYGNKRAFPHPENKMLYDFGVRFKIVAGCWGTKKDIWSLLSA